MKNSRLERKLDGPITDDTLASLPLQIRAFYVRRFLRDRQRMCTERAGRCLLAEALQRSKGGTKSAHRGARALPRAPGSLGAHSYVERFLERRAA